MTDNESMIPIIEAAEDKQLLKDTGLALIPPCNINKNSKIESIKELLLEHIAQHSAATEELLTSPELTPATDTTPAEGAVPPETIAPTTEATPPADTEESAAQEKPKQRRFRHKKTGRILLWSEGMDNMSQLVEVSE
ncbi:hypothetical protein [uncultured Amphritea sp.]|uniref:hypothetical protein n=1 Tax=uncultured Amphritea sp. TaxID=981605 RepID=UPI002604436A|nr:hypothetical protein [uncultured Amphritea sp.]